MAFSTEAQLALTATEAVAAIQSGRLASADYTATLLARAKALGQLNALTALDEDAALAAARAVDALTPEARARLPLAGLPIVVKDNINTARLPTTGGTPSLAGFVARNNAPSAQALFDAGAILLGKSNMHEMALGITSTNLSPHVGPVRNPYDMGRIPGGSSGGTAVAVAARIVTAGLGSDTGGSTRIPAALTGTVGFRPSVGDGGPRRRYHDDNAVVPISRTRDTVGPMARTAADVALLDAVITGAGPLSDVALADLRIGLLAECWQDLDHELAATAHAAIDRLRGAGVTFTEVSMPQLHTLCAQISMAIALTEPVRDVADWLIANEAPVQTVAGLAAQIASPDVRGAYDVILAGGLPAQYAEAMQVWRPQLQQHYAQTFAAHQIDALLFPTTPLPAVPIDFENGSSTVSINGGAPIDEMAAYLRHTDGASVAGIPGLSLPAGMTASGLPIGLELDGPLGSDRRVLAIGAALERVLGPVPAPML
ncbi:indoleacetamide hydrolase [Ralstonia sp. 24A2]|uniref:indoleacetamide hydrolase n=1 Tax=Ralstonia sp. 24A2 TaxID=3447364 RepID=UPI003F699BD7